MVDISLKWQADFLLDWVLIVYKLAVHNMITFVCGWAPKHSFAYYLQFGLVPVIVLAVQPHTGTLRKACKSLCQTRALYSASQINDGGVPAHTKLIESHLSYDFSCKPSYCPITYRSSPCGVDIACMQMPSFTCLRPAINGQFPQYVDCKWIEYV